MSDATNVLYGPNSKFNEDEQAAMRRGYTQTERMAISGRVYGICPQAISQAHADKLDAMNFGDKEIYELTDDEKSDLEFGGDPDWYKG